MPTPPVTVSKSGPGFAQLKRDLDRLRRSDVLVGVPADKAQRKGEPITNASLMFIHSKGSPLKGIPPRPTLEPAIEENKAPIAKQLGMAAKAITDDNPAAAERALNRAGIIAVNAAKRKFGTGELAPNAPSTIKKKGSDAPLIDKSLLRRSLTQVVRVPGKAPIEGAE